LIIQSRFGVGVDVGDDHLAKILKDVVEIHIFGLQFGGERGVTGVLSDDWLGGRIRLRTRRERNKAGERQATEPWYVFSESHQRSTYQMTFVAAMAMPCLPADAFRAGPEHVFGDSACNWELQNATNAAGKTVLQWLEPPRRDKQ
jgi:hypothetical protein